MRGKHGQMGPGAKLRRNNQATGQQDTMNLAERDERKSGREKAVVEWKKKENPGSFQ